jgi:hypothetical protein
MTNATRTISHIQGLRVRSQDVDDLETLVRAAARRVDERTQGGLYQALHDAQRASGIAAIKRALERDDGTHYTIEVIEDAIAKWRGKVQAIVDGLPADALKKARNAIRQRQHKAANPVRRMDVRIPTADRLRRFADAQGATLSDAIDGLLDARGAP